MRSSRSRRCAWRIHAEAHLERRHVFGYEPGVGRDEAFERARHESRTHEHDASQRQLRAHEQTLGTPRTTGARTVPASALIVATPILVSRRMQAIARTGFR